MEFRTILLDRSREDLFRLRQRSGMSHTVLSPSSRRLIAGFQQLDRAELKTRLWHKHWRSRERAQLATIGPDGELMPIHRHAVSSTWDLAKDGKSRFSPRRQQLAAEREAAGRSELKPERKALQAQILAKWRGK